MAHGSRKTAALLSGAAAIALGLGIAPASAAPLTASGSPPPAPWSSQPRSSSAAGRRSIPITTRRPRRPGGWSFYFGPVPYAKGDYETQALQRVYPQLNYPPSMRYWTPQSGF